MWSRKIIKNIKNWEFLVRLNKTDYSSFPIWLINNWFNSAVPSFPIFCIFLNFSGQKLSISHINDMISSPCLLASGGIWNVKIIESPLRMGQYRDDDHRENAPHFNFRPGSNSYNYFGMWVMCLPRDRCYSGWDEMRLVNLKWTSRVKVVHNEK